MKISTIILLIFISNLVVASPFVKPSEPNGMLNLATNHPSKDIFPVSLFEIDGKQIIRRDNAVWLKPGEHSIKVSATIDLSSRSSFVTRIQKINHSSSNKTLEIDVEEGKTYYVGYDTSDRDPNKWRPVVWKVK